MTNSAELLTKREVAQALRRTTRTIDLYRARGLLSAIKLTPHAHCLFRRDDVERLLASGQARSDELSWR